MHQNLVANIWPKTLVSQIFLSYFATSFSPHYKCYIFAHGCKFSCFHPSKYKVNNKIQRIFVSSKEVPASWNIGDNISGDDRLLYAQCLFWLPQTILGAVLLGNGFTLVWWKNEQPHISTEISHLHSVGGN
ncbi:hypothetical protein ACOSQ3_011723 [Xanthoceras sorbifolium]